MSIRYRLVAMCLVVALLPAIPLSILVSTLLEKSFNVGLSETMRDALDSGVTVSRRHLDQLHQDFEAEAGRVASALSEVSPGGVPDARVLAAAVSGARAEHRVDGFIVGGLAREGASQDTNPAGRTPERALDSRIPRPLSAYSSEPVFSSLTGNTAVAERTPSSAAPPGVAFYETQNRAVQFALWSPARGDGSVLLYKRTDPELLAHAQRLLSGRQLFAQLRLSQANLNRSFFYPFMVVYGVIIVLSLCFAFLMAERLAAPIRRLATATSAVAAGDWRVQLQERGGGEVGRLVDSFNRMVSRLDAQRRRLIDLEKMASWRDMARHLAHEIKNPLLPIRLTVQEMKDQYDGGDERYRQLLSESARVVEDELNHLQRLVKEFSSFARMPSLSPVQGSLEQLARDVAKLYPQAETSVESDPRVQRSVFDPDSMRSVLINLFDNSLSMMPPERRARIRVRIHAANDFVVLDFADNGLGIPAEHVSKIFEPYFSTRKGGTGLGLAMVKNIVLLHEGTIEARSRENEGAAFTITLPVAGPGRTREGEQ